MNAIDQQMDAVQGALIKLKTDLKKIQPNSPKALELIERIKNMEQEYNDLYEKTLIKAKGY